MQPSSQNLKKASNSGGMNFTLNILGTASALPMVNRYPSAQVLDVRGRLFLIDCGEGVQMQIRRQHLSILKLDTIFITHLHGDHTFGIYGLLSTMSMLGRTAPLHIYAPKAFGKILSDFMFSFGDGFKFEPVHHTVSAEEPVKIFETRSIEVLAFPLRHRIETYGYMFREKTPAKNVRKDAIARFGLSLAEIGTLKRGEDVLREDGTVILNAEAAYRPYEPRSFAYCSDTAPFPELAGWVKGVDLLYHEATFPCGYETLARNTFHSTVMQAAECARDACVRQLVLGHYSSRFPDVSFYLDEIAGIFPGAILASEGMVIDIPLKKYR